MRVHAYLLCVRMHVPVSMCMPINMCIFFISVCLYMRLCSARVSVFRLHLLRCVSLWFLYLSKHLQAQKSNLYVGMRRNHYKFRQLFLSVLLLFVYQKGNRETGGGLGGGVSGGVQGWEECLQVERSKKQTLRLTACLILGNVLKLVLD